jgi:hypothetical protein
MAKSTKSKTKRASKYNEKLAIKGSLEDVKKVSVNYTPKENSEMKALKKGK